MSTTWLRHQPIEELASRKKLHHQVDGRVGFIYLVQLDNVLMVKACQNHRFLDEALPRLRRNTQQIDRFQSVVFMCLSTITDNRRTDTCRSQHEHFQ